MPFTDIIALIFCHFCDSVFAKDRRWVNNPRITLDEKRTTQDDPFDRWVASILKGVGIEHREIFTGGSLTHPDIVVRYKIDSEVSYLGIEVKKLNANEKGTDPRGMTIDYNSTIPCGKFRVYTPRGDSFDIKGYYIFALLDHRVESLERNILSFVFADGDLLNDDFELYLDSKTRNESEYNHGPYGEGSVRGRNMYLYPNPLDSKIFAFSGKVSLVHTDPDLHLNFPLRKIYRVRRPKLNGSENVFYIYRHTNSPEQFPDSPSDIGLFEKCTKRSKKKRSPYKFVVG